MNPALKDRAKERLMGGVKPYQWILKLYWLGMIWIFCLGITVKAEGRNHILADELVSLKEQIGTLEQSLLESLKGQKNTKYQVKKIQKLLQLQKKEKELGELRLKELEKTIAELEARREALKERIHHQQHEIRKTLIAIESSRRGEMKSEARSFYLLNQADQEKIETPRRKVLSRIADRGLKELEALRVDLTDASVLASKIQDEQHQLTYLFQDLKEQEGVLELNQQLQIEILKKKQKDRKIQLQNYRNLKMAEAQVEKLIQDFNARKELSRTLEAEQKDQADFSQALSQSFSKSLVPSEKSFADSKGKLSLPILGGKVISQFGRSFDAHSRLYVFKKGIDISASKNSAVRAIFGGRVAFSGELPNYGKVIILDHGHHFYSLCAHLGAISKKTNQQVTAGESIGITSDKNTPLYFEIRLRNVAVNPLQWVFN